jgi:hypothetical protein
MLYKPPNSWQNISASYSPRKDSNMKKLTATALLVALVALVGFRLTHHPIYGNCHNTADGYTCTLLAWKGNK